MGLGDGMDSGVLIDGQCTVRGLDGGAVQDLVSVKRTTIKHWSCRGEGHSVATYFMSFLRQGWSIKSLRIYFTFIKML